MVVFGGIIGSFAALPRHASGQAHDMRRGRQDDKANHDLSSWWEGWNRAEVIPLPDADFH